MPNCVCQVGPRSRQPRTGRLCRSQCCMHLHVDSVFHILHDELDLDQGEAANLLMRS